MFLLFPAVTGNPHINTLYCGKVRTHWRSDIDSISRKVTFLEIYIFGNYNDNDN